MNICCEQLLSQKTVAVAISGGKDSVCLLHYLHANSKKLGIKNLVAVNVEHGIRGDESIADSNFVKKLCDKLNITCYLYTVDAVKEQKSSGLSLEESARKLRYGCFYDLKNKGLCDVIVTAHHKSDNTESVLFNLVRGTGLKGLKGIPKNNDDFILRPFLTVDKEEIDCYIKANALDYVTDQTNFCLDYTRNFLRLEVIPKLKEKFNKLDESILRLSTIVEKEDAYLDNLAKKQLFCDGDNYLIPVSCDEVLFIRATIFALNGLGVKKDYEKKHLDAIYSLTGAKNGTKYDVKFGVVAIKEYDHVRLFKTVDNDKQKVLPFNLNDFSFDAGDLSITLLDEKPTNFKLQKGVHYADLDKLDGTFLRMRQNGDVFTPIFGKTKKLKDYFIDKKIPLIKRDGLPLIVDGNEVLYIAGIEISNKIKVDENTKNVIKLSYTTKEK